MKRPHIPNIAADPIGAVLILSGPPGETGMAPAILLRSDGSAAALHAIPGADGVWSLSDPIEQLTPQKVRDCFLGMKIIRREAAQEIERLIALLDRLDPDPDLEENGDNDADESEREPSLGSLDAMTNQKRWTDGTRAHNEHDADLEGEHDGREPDEDGEPTLGEGQHDGEVEPSLGSFDKMMDQSKSYLQTDNYYSYDAEDDGGDREPDDHDSWENPATLNVR